MVRVFCLQQRRDGTAGLWHQWQGDCACGLQHYLGVAEPGGPCRFHRWPAASWGGSLTASGGAARARSGRPAACLRKRTSVSKHRETWSTMRLHGAQCHLSAAALLLRPQDMQPSSVPFLSLYMDCGTLLTVSAHVQSRHGTCCCSANSRQSYSPLCLPHCRIGPRT